MLQSCLLRLCRFLRSLQLTSCLRQGFLQHNEAPSLGQHIDKQKDNQKENQKDNLKECLP